MAPTQGLVLIRCQSRTAGARDHQKAGSEEKAGFIQRLVLPYLLILLLFLLSTSSKVCKDDGPSGSSHPWPSPRHLFQNLP